MDRGEFPVSCNRTSDRYYYLTAFCHNRSIEESRDIVAYCHRATCSFIISTKSYLDSLQTMRRLVFAFKVILTTIVGIGLVNLIARWPRLSNSKSFTGAALSHGTANLFSSVSYRLD
jgi:hypothetical protein